MNKRLIKYIMLVYILNCYSSFASVKIDNFNFNIYYEHQQKVCQTYTFPKNQKGMPRGKKTFLIISKNPNNNLKINIGYPIKNKAKVLVKIDNKRFYFSSNNNYAYPKKNNNQEVIKFITNAKELTVKTKLKNNIRILDTYDIKNIDKAIKYINSECNKIN